MREGAPATSGFDATSRLQDAALHRAMIPTRLHAVRAFVRKRLSLCMSAVGGGQRTLHVALLTVISCAWATATLAPRAMAAYPGENGVIAYFFPDPEPQVDAAYLGFVTPDGATAPSKWVRSWNFSESA